MKKWVVRIAGVFVLLLLVLIGTAFWSDSDVAVLTGRVSVPELKTVRPDWPGTPVDQRGRFMNDEFVFLPKTSELLKWQLSSNEFAAERERDTFRPEVRDPSAFLAGDEDGILWLGHASFYIRLEGRGILIDPIFGSPPLVERWVEVPSPLEKIRRVDYVLLSHDHRDHTDEATLRAVAEKFPAATFIAGMGSEEMLRGWIKPTNKVSVAGWFQRFELGDDAVEVYFVPVRHWSRRGLFDTNRRLWGGYVIKSRSASIYHGGDSGYGRHYRETGELFPDIDYFLIAIGAYEPRWFMEANHTNPADVVNAFGDIGAKWLVPMHYGTFDLSDESPGMPLRQLTEEAEKARITDKIRTLAINEHIPIAKPQTAEEKK